MTLPLMAKSLARPLLWAVILMLPVFSTQAAATAALTIIFHQDSAELSQDARNGLDQLVERRAKQDRPSRLIIAAFAVLPDQPAWAAHRLALARALAVRDYLLRKAVKPKEMILKPIGNVCAAPCSRVDISLARR